MNNLQATLHDGNAIDVEVYGEGPTLLLPVNPRPAEGELAEQMRQYGNDPALGQSFIKGLSDAFRVVAFDYEGHVLRVPKTLTLTPENVAKDLLAIADAAGAKQFAYYSYSWLAVIGLQLALRTDRLTALIMGGYPPLDGPYKEMLGVTMAAHEMSEKPLNPDDEWAVATSKDQTQQFVTLYEALQSFDDRAAQSKLTCPRLCFVGSADAIQYAENWGSILVDIARPVIGGRAELERFGWDVRVLDGMDHIQAMQATHVVPVIRPWLVEKLIEA
jgi:pimeloyl-ACP methyl ester carboxylesterase